MRKAMTVKQNLLCVLFVCGGASWAMPDLLASVPQTASSTSPCSIGKGQGIVEGRLEVPSTEPLKLEEANEIPILTHGLKVHSVNVSLSYYNMNGELMPPDGEADVTVMYRKDEEAYVNIIPEKLGKVQIALLACFEDGALANAWSEAEVVFPDRKPNKFYVISSQGSDARPSGTIYIGLTERSRRIRLFPKVLYEGAVHPVQIPASRVKFKIITTSDSTVPISIDESTGIITALNVGHVLVQTSFEIFSALTCVDVMRNVSDGSDRTVCQELVPKGMTAPLTGLENSDPPPRVKPRKQP